jgi:hypothetical protein
MKAHQDAYQAFDAFANELQQLQHAATQQYQPLVDELIRSNCQDANSIEHVLDGLLDFCGHEPVLQLYKKLCRHYWTIDPASTAEHIQFYREQWDNDEQEINS